MINFMLQNKLYFNVVLKYLLLFTCCPHTNVNYINRYTTVIKKNHVYMYHDPKTLFSILHINNFNYDFQLTWKCINVFYYIIVLICYACCGLNRSEKAIVNTNCLFICILCLNLSIKYCHLDFGDSSFTRCCLPLIVKVAKTTRIICPRLGACSRG